MPGEANERRAIAAPRPEIVHAVRADALAAESERREPRRENVEAARVLRRDGAARNQLAREFESIDAHDPETGNE
jgi:hypothetical protein